MDYVDDCLSHHVMGEALLQHFLEWKLSRYLNSIGNDFLNVSAAIYLLSFSPVNSLIAKFPLKMKMNFTNHLIQNSALFLRQILTQTREFLASVCCQNQKLVPDK